jgi:hypothetical protein
MARINITTSSYLSIIPKTIELEIRDNADALRSGKPPMGSKMLITSAAALEIVTRIYAMANSPEYKIVAEIKP